MADLPPEWSGWLMKRQEIDRMFRGSFVCSYKRYFFRLRDGRLSMYATARQGENELDSLQLDLEAKAVRPCAQVELSGVPYAFEIVHTSGRWLLCTENDRDYEIVLPLFSQCLHEFHDQGVSDAVWDTARRKLNKGDITEREVWHNLFLSLHVSHSDSLTTSYST
jgi:hypothetical protein